MLLKTKNGNMELRSKIIQVLEQHEEEIEAEYANGILESNYDSVAEDVEEIIKNHNAEKEAIKQYKISLFNEIDYYVNNMLRFEDLLEHGKIVGIDDLQKMIQEMQNREF